MSLKELLKLPFKNELIRDFFCWLGAQYIRLVYSSSHWEVIGSEIATTFWESGKPFILAFWHGRILMMPYCWIPEKKIHMLISQHRDGQIISRIVGYFGIHTIPGSTRKGGSVAFRNLLKALKAGECIGITPDGPHGPRMVVSEGIVQVARLTGVPVIPCTFATQRRHLLKTWDRFWIALPFTRGVFIWGQPLFIPPKANADEQEAFRQKIQSALIQITNEADRKMGHTALGLE